MLFCRHHFDDLFLTNEKPWRNEFDYYIHDCYKDTLNQELIDLRDAKHKKRITETEFESKTTSLTQNHITGTTFKT